MQFISNHKSCFRRLLSLFIYISFSNSAIWAQTVVTPDLPQVGNSQAEKSKTEGFREIPKTEVIAVYNKDHSDIKDPKHMNAGLGEKIVIHVKNIGDLLNRATVEHKEIKLFLNGQQIDDLKPISGAADKDEGDFEFTLERTTTNDKEWKDLLGRPKFGNEFFLRKVKVSVGIDGSYAERSLVDNFELVRINKHWFYGCLIALVTYLILLFWLASNTSLLRDSPNDLTILGITPNGKLPWSLGKVQMAFWFSLTLVAFLFIWRITGNYDIISTGILGLIGISATTALGAVAIGNGKAQKAVEEISALVKQTNDLQVLIPTLPQNSPEAISKNAELIQLNNTISKKKNSLQLNSVSFFDDLLTDANGISFHRLQMIIWTVALGVVFLNSAWESLIMPDFSATLLALQGITAGTYLGFKLPEKQ